MTLCVSWNAPSLVWFFSAYSLNWNKKSQILSSYLNINIELITSTSLCRERDCVNSLWVNENIIITFWFSRTDHIRLNQTWHDFQDSKLWTFGTELCSDATCSCFGSPPGRNPNKPHHVHCPRAHQQHRLPCCRTPKNRRQVHPSLFISPAQSPTR